MQAKNLNINPYIYILYYQQVYLIIFHPISLFILEKWNIYL